MFDPASAQGLDCIFGPFQSSVLWFSGVSGKISWSRWEYHPPDQKGQKDTMTPGNNINRRTPDTGKSSYCFVVLYLLVWFFSCFIIPFCSLCRVYYTDLLICSCGTFITHNITHECVSGITQASGITFQANTIVEMEEWREKYFLLTLIFEEAWLLHVAVRVFS